MGWELIVAILLLSIVGYITMVSIIYFLAPTKILNSFPEKCNVKTKCTRVANYNNRGYGLKPIETKENIANLQEKIVNIIEAKPRMKIINEKNGFIHAIDITPFFRFYDDITIKIFNDEGKTIVWMQSQSRLGLYDFQVNEKRIQELHNDFSLI